MSLFFHFPVLSSSKMYEEPFYSNQPNDNKYESLGDPINVNTSFNPIPTELEENSTQMSFMEIDSMKKRLKKLETSVRKTKKKSNCHNNSNNCCSSSTFSNMFSGLLKVALNIRRSPRRSKKSRLLKRLQKHKKKPKNRKKSKSQEMDWTIESDQTTLLSSAEESVCNKNFVEKPSCSGLMNAKEGIRQEPVSFFPLLIYF